MAICISKVLLCQSTSRLYCTVPPCDSVLHDGGGTYCMSCILQQTWDCRLPWMTIQMVLMKSMSYELETADCYEQMMHHDAPLCPSLRDKCGVRYVSMGNINLTLLSKGWLQAADHHEPETQCSIHLWFSATSLFRMKLLSLISNSSSMINSTQHTTI